MVETANNAKASQKPALVPAQARKQELRVFVFLTVFLAPIISIALVGSLGFAIWACQLISGPPTS